MRPAIRGSWVAILVSASVVIGAWPWGTLPMASGVAADRGGFPSPRRVALPATATPKT